jgi:hypothetical protein
LNSIRERNYSLASLGGVEGGVDVFDARCNLGANLEVATLLEGFRKKLQILTRECASRDATSRFVAGTDTLADTSRFDRSKNYIEKNICTLL